VRLIRQIVLTAGTRVGLTVFGLATSIITARFLGQAGRGDYFFIATLSALIVQFANLGLPASNTFFAARDPERIGQLLSNSCWIAIGVGGGLGAGVAVFAQAAGVLQDTPVGYLWLAAALAVPSLLYLLLTSILVGRGQIRSFNALEVAARGLLLPALIAAGLVGLEAAGFIAVSVAVWGAACVVGILLVGRYASLTQRPDWELIAAGFRYATKSYLITLAAFLALRGNVFLLRREFGPPDLGLYSIALQIGEMLTILPAAVAVILFPNLVRDATARWDRARVAALWVALIMAVVCLTTAIFAGPVIGLAFGAEFAPSTRVLQIMLPSVFSLAVAGVLSQYLAAIGLPRPMLGVWIGGMVLVLALSFALVPDHGAAGAAASLSAGHAAILVGIATVAWLYRNAPQRGPRPLVETATSGPLEPG
jgi:O-antigen/teichoic acid export membrane protein